MGTLTGKHIKPVPCQPTQASQQRHSLYRQWHGVDITLLFLLLGAQQFTESYRLHDGGKALAPVGGQPGFQSLRDVALGAGGGR